MLKHLLCCALCVLFLCNINVLMSTCPFWCSRPAGWRNERGRFFSLRLAHNDGNHSCCTLRAPCEHVIPIYDTTTRTRALCLSLSLPHSSTRESGVIVLGQLITRARAHMRGCVCVCLC